MRDAAFASRLEQSCRQIYVHLSIWGQLTDVDRGSCCPTRFIGQSRQLAVCSDRVTLFRGLRRCGFAVTKTETYELEICLPHTLEVDRFLYRESAEIPRQYTAYPLAD